MPTKKISNVIYFYHQDSWLSNHYPAKFKIKGKTFSCVEQCYFYSKAIVFNDLIMADAILNTIKANKIMQLNALMHLHDYADWSEDRRFKIMLAITFAKYSQNNNLGQRLLATNSALIIEASPNQFWGSGVHINSSLLTMEKYWTGKNMLGIAIMMVRGMLGGIGVVGVDKKTPV